MAYTRYFAIRNRDNTRTYRTIPTGASDLRCWIAGREAGGYNLRAEAIIPATFPEDYGIRRGDLVEIGWDSNSHHHWWHGIIYLIEKGGYGSTDIKITAYGIEEWLKSIKPRINFGANPANPYLAYDNPTTTQISLDGSTNSIVYKLWYKYIKDQIPWVYGIYDFDSSASDTDITYLEYTGEDSLYDIFNSLAERTGFSWGFDPTSASVSHTFFFRARSSVFNPNVSRFYYKPKGNLVSLSFTDSIEQATNDVILIGSKMKILQRRYSRRLYEPYSKTILGSRMINRRMPGLQLTADAQIQAAKILDRRSNPSEKIDCEIILDSELQISTGVPLFPDKLKIEIVNQNGTLINSEDEQQYTREIECEFASHTIVLRFTLGESGSSDSEVIQDTILEQSGVSPKQAYSYDVEAETWTIDTDQYDTGSRVDVITIPAIVETVPSGDPLTADVRLASDSSGGDPADVYKTLYQNIPVPAGTSQGDTLDAKHFFEDDELQDIQMEIPGVGTGTGGTGSGLTLDEIQYALATGTLSLNNTTVIKDISNYTPTEPVDGVGDTALNAADTTYPNAHLGNLIRIPAADQVALNTGVYALVSAAHNTAGVALPSGDPTQALLFGTVLGITTNGEVALGNPSGGITTVNVKTAPSTVQLLRIIQATDPTYGAVAAPLGAVLRGNS